jgi:hypothetical protein
MAKRPLKLSPKKGGGKKSGVGKKSISRKSESSSEDFSGNELSEAAEEGDLALETRSLMVSELDADGPGEVELDFESESSATEVDGEGQDTKIDESLTLDDNEAEIEIDKEQSLSVEDEIKPSAEPNLVGEGVDREQDVFADRDVEEARVSPLEKDDRAEQVSEVDDVDPDGGGDALIESAEKDHSLDSIDRDKRPTTEGKRLCACPLCGVEYYLLKELENREAICVKCEKVFCITFSDEDTVRDPVSQKINELEDSPSVSVEEDVVDVVTDAVDEDKNSLHLGEVDPEEIKVDDSSTEEELSDFNPPSESEGLDEVEDLDLSVEESSESEEVVEDLDLSIDGSSEPEDVGEVEDLELSIEGSSDSEELEEAEDLGLSIDGSPEPEEVDGVEELDLSEDVSEEDDLDLSVEGLSEPEQMGEGEELDLQIEGNSGQVSELSIENQSVETVASTTEATLQVESELDISEQESTLLEEDEEFSLPVDDLKLDFDDDVSFDFDPKQGDSEK